jgi:hypothetical protein
MRAPAPWVPHAAAFVFVVLLYAALLLLLYGR